MFYDKFTIAGYTLDRDVVVGAFAAVVELDIGLPCVVGRDRRIPVEGMPVVEVVG